MDQATLPASTLAWFPADSGELPAVRAHVRRTLLERGRAEVLDGPVELLVSELCSNVVEHTGSDRIGLKLEVGPDGTVHVAVQQSVRSELPVFVVAGEPGTVRGRGLQLVDALADAWGTSRRDQLTTTWFTLEPATATAAPTAAHGPTISDAWPRRAFRPDGSTEGALRASLHRSQLLLRITEALSNAPDEQAIADAITRTLCEPLCAAFAGIAVLADEDLMRYLSLEPLPAATAADWASFPLTSTAPVAAAVRTGTAYFHTGPAAAEAEFPGIGAHMRTAATAAMAHLPLTARGRTFGTLAVSWAGEWDIDADTRALLQVVAGYTAHALAR